ncbi:amp-forming long-chain acyl- synthetase [Leptolyngbya sp. Heron Island J]|uniref:AMP-dependent synthetase/ligase n=1 Tax=Leptolyngbya sp. Heron Island J TaxID=1385935 RepID=UPI0003B999E9|nr:AMP-binding protein [Leptolyngbya sp. Heron Island J]ESA37270.1 amp-forming long-chain acyl- synthetase [Leptolyngbya sp. Heron Island J]
MTAATLTPQEQSNLAQAIDYSHIQSIAEIWPIVADRFPNQTAVEEPHGTPEITLTYGQLAQQIQQFAAGLQTLGIQPQDKIALFSDNQPRWLVADQGIMTAGAVDAVRGSQADKDELGYILEHSDSVAIIVQDQATLTKLADHLADKDLRFIALLSDETPQLDTATKLLNFKQLMELGAGVEVQTVEYSRGQLATLMYTSGTSGRPKGVMLSQANLLSQIAGACSVVHPKPGSKVMSILPIWHCYERTFEYFTLSQGVHQIYTSIRHVKSDLKSYKPNYMVGVPRLWESIYEGVQKQFREQPDSKQKLINFFLHQSQRYITAKRIADNLSLNDTPGGFDRAMASTQCAVLKPFHKLGDTIVYKKVREATGGNINFVVSGGGSIADHLEDFYEIIGVDILGGYGLTETSPITHVRRPWQNLRGADGQPLPGTQTRIVDLETRQDVPQGQQGLVLIRGPQVMQGYYKNPEATTKAIDPDGWFDTGDLGKITANGDLIITGRAKDTIVLTNGENIEPQPVENACARSKYVDQIMLVGQDQKVLGALIVPNLEALSQWAATQGITINETNPAESLSNPKVQTLFKQELTREVKARPGHRPDERIGPFTLLSEPFSIENGMLTQTLKIKRPVVTRNYQNVIDGLFE